MINAYNRETRNIRIDFKKYAYRYYFVFTYPVCFFTDIHIHLFLFFLLLQVVTEGFFELLLFSPMNNVTITEKKQYVLFITVFYCYLWSLKHTWKTINRQDKLINNENLMKFYN